MSLERQDYMKILHKYKIKENIAIIEIIRRDKTEFKTVIDKEDLSRVLEHKWSVTSRGNKYLHATINNKSVYLHHFLIGKPGCGKVIDHRDRDTFNNCKSNLFFVSRGMNNANHRIERKNINRYGFPGIYYIPDSKIKRRGGKLWIARMRITKNNITHLLYLGAFFTLKETIEARKKAEFKYHGIVFH